MLSGTNHFQQARRQSTEYAKRQRKPHEGLRKNERRHPTKILGTRTPFRTTVMDCAAALQAWAVLYHETKPVLASLDSPYMNDIKTLIGAPSFAGAEDNMGSLRQDIPVRVLLTRRTITSLRS